MKFLPLALTLAALQCFAVADMVIVQKVEGGGQSGPMTLKFKGDKVRADISEQISTITDGQTGDVMTVMHAQKSFMKIPGSTTKALMERMQKMQTPGANGSPAAVPKPVATGKTEKIGVYNTAEYTAEIGGMTVHYWIAKDFPEWSKILAQMLKMQQNGLGAMARGISPNAGDFPGMPIRTEMEMGGQKVTTTLVSVKEEPLSDADFQVPAGYKAMQMPTFGDPSGAAPAP